MVEGKYETNLEPDKGMSERRKWNWCGGDYLILVVLIGLVIIFKAQLTELVQTIFSKITSESGKI